MEKMFYVYEKNIHDEDYRAIEVCRTEDKVKAFDIKNRRLKRDIEVFIYENDKEIWRGHLA